MNEYNRMNKIEVKSYLESIYGVKVAHVATQNILGKLFSYNIL